jgi:hypothetical protein
MSITIEKSNPETILNQSFEYLKKPIASKEDEKKMFSILSLLNNKHDKGNSTKTTDTILSETDCIKFFDYKFESIKKFDEFNQSMGDISDFDLEGDEEEAKSIFNSSEEDNDIDEEEIIIKSKNRVHKQNNKEYEIQLDREFDEILEELNIKKKIV